MKTVRIEKTITGPSLGKLLDIGIKVTVDSDPAREVKDGITLMLSEGEHLFKFEVLVSSLFIKMKTPAKLEKTIDISEDTYIKVSFANENICVSTESYIPPAAEQKPVISQAAPKYVLEGLKGELRVYEDKVEINKKGSGFITGNSCKTLPMSNITSVSVTPCTVWARGFIEFSIPGSRDSKRVEAAMNNENALLLKNAKQNETAMQIKAYIDEQIIKCSNTKVGTTIIQQANSPAEELKKFKELLDAGIITEDEFNAKKKQLLGL